jgi:hypothetical protein
MSKQIKPSELSEIVTGLLIRPDLMGELDSPEQHERFIEAIGQVVVDFCGGEINGVGHADLPEGHPVSYIHTPYLSVYPDDSLPSLEECVWAPYDPQGWMDESAEEYALATGIAPTETAILHQRQRLQGLTTEAYKAELAEQYSDPKPTIRQWYVNGNHGLCPACQGNDITGDSVQIDDNRASQSVGCSDCDAEWTDVYTLSDVESEDFNPDDPATSATKAVS